MGSPDLDQWEASASIVPAKGANKAPLTPAKMPAIKKAMNLYFFTGRPRNSVRAGFPRMAKDLTERRFDD